MKTKRFTRDHRQRAWPICNACVWHLALRPAHRQYSRAGCARLIAQSSPRGNGQQPSIGAKPPCCTSAVGGISPTHQDPKVAHSPPNYLELPFFNPLPPPSQLNSHKLCTAQARPLGCGGQLIHSVLRSPTRTSAPARPSKLRPCAVPRATSSGSCHVRRIPGCGW